MRDLLARRSEVAALDVADITHDRDGSGTAMIRRSKTDQTGDGAELYLSPRAMDHLRKWLEAASITEGAIFRTVKKGDRVGERIEDYEVARIVKRVAEQAGLPPETVERISGHSCRVGMAQD
jgi:integrase